MKVYLSGGMYSGWQEEAAKGLPGITVLDPCKSGLVTPEGWTLWDIEAVKQSDVILVYFEEDNPSGIGLSLEMGIALALNKTIVLIDLMDDKRTQILRQSATIVLESLSGACDFVCSLKEIYD